MKALLVKAIFDRRPDTDWVHRFRNFGEDVWRELKEESDLTIGEIDSSISSFEVHGLKSRRVGRAKQVLGRLIDCHGFAGELEVRELE